MRRRSPPLHKSALDELSSYADRISRQTTLSSYYCSPLPNPTDFYAPLVQALPLLPLATSTRPHLSNNRSYTLVNITFRRSPLIPPYPTTRENLLHSNPISPCSTLSPLNHPLPHCHPYTPALVLPIPPPSTPKSFRTVGNHHQSPTECRGTSPDPRSRGR